MTDLGLIKSFLTPPLWRRNSGVKVQVFLGMTKGWGGKIGHRLALLHTSCIADFGAECDHTFLINRRIFWLLERFYYLCIQIELKNVRIFTEQTLKEYIEKHPDARTALQEWVSIVKHSDWTCFADIKATFNSVDSVGNQHYVFNIKGNNYRLVVVIKFTIKFVYIRFIGTHAEYDKIDCSTI